MSSKVKPVTKKKKGTVKKKKPTFHTLVTRASEPEIVGFVYGLMAETEQTMQDILKMMILHCAKDKTFKVPRKMSATLQKQIESREQRLRKYKAIAGQEEDE